MEKSYYALLLLLTASLASPAAHAQTGFRPGYVVRPAGDTVQGQVNYRGARRNSLECQFRAASGAPVETLTPATLRGYTVQGLGMYRSRLTPQPDSAGQPRAARPYFVEVLADGPAALYQRRDGSDENHFYLQKDTAAPLRELLVQHREVHEGTRQYSQDLPMYRGVLSEAFADCPALLLSLARTELTTASLAAAVQRYNACRQPGGRAAAPVEQGRQARIGLEVLAGGLGSRINFKGDFNQAAGTFSGAVAPAFGLALQGSTRTLNQKLALRLEANYARQHYEAEYAFRPARSAGAFVGNDTYQSRLTTQYLRVPLLLRYSPFTTGPVRPFIEVGIEYGFLLQLDAEQRSHTDQTTTFGAWQPALTSVNTRSSESGYVLGLGTQLPALAGHPLAVLARYETSGGFIEGTVSSANQQRYSLQLAFGLLK